MAFYVVMVGSGRVAEYPGDPGAKQIVGLAHPSFAEAQVEAQVLREQTGRADVWVEGLWLLNGAAKEVSCV